jgi:hypothetical protein
MSPLLLNSRRRILDSAEDRRIRDKMPNDFLSVRGNLYYEGQKTNEKSMRPETIQIFKLLRSPGIDSKESIPPVYEA